MKKSNFAVGLLTALAVVGVFALVMLAVLILL